MKRMIEQYASLPWVKAGVEAESLRVPAGFDGLAALSVAIGSCTAGASLLIGWILDNPSSWIASTLAMILRGAATWLLLAWLLRFWIAAVRRSNDLEENWLITAFGLICWVVVIVVGVNSTLELHVERNLDAALALVDRDHVGLGPAGGAIYSTIGALALAGAVAAAASTCDRLWFGPVGPAIWGLTTVAVVANTSLLLLNLPELLIASSSPDGRTALTWAATAVRGLPFLALIVLSFRLERVRRAPA